VDLGANSINQKSHAGDRTTPEGLYRITKKKGYGQSKYGLALLLDYPNAEDRRRFSEAKARGQITKRTGIGGLIEIHGEGGRGVDWTDGCIAPDNRDMEVLFREGGVGTMVAIVGSDGGVGPVRSALRRAGAR
jgi:murein L,D-transpeptidase YafK